MNWHFSFRKTICAIDPYLVPQLRLELQRMAAWRRQGPDAARSTRNDHFGSGDGQLPVNSNWKETQIRRFAIALFSAPLR